jgi:AraC-like DNA-binding protein
MHFEFGFYSSILLIFFVHGMVYSLLLLQKGIRNENASDKWLSVFLLLSVLYICPWMLGFAGWYDTQPYRDILFYVTFQHLFFIGPVIFFYVQSLLNPSFHFSKKHSWHLFPGMLYLVYSFVIVVVDKLLLNDYYFLSDGADREFDTWYQTIGYLSMAIYFGASIRYYYLYKQLMLQVVSYADTVQFKWVRNFLFAFLFILVLQFVLFVISFFVKILYIGNWWYFLGFSIAFYYIAVSGYANSVRTKMRFSADLFTSKPALLLQYQTVNDSLVEEAEMIIMDDQAMDQTADEAFIKEWKDKIQEMVVAFKMYEEPELSLTDLAKKLRTNPSLLSRAINKGFGMNFNDFVNYYRVQAVVEKLKAGEQQTQTLLSIAYDCGFNSKATFNRAFKKALGTSPKTWMEQQGES